MLERIEVHAETDGKCVLVVNIAIRIAILETKMYEELKLSAVLSHISIGSYNCRRFNKQL